MELTAEGREIWLQGLKEGDEVFVTGNSAVVSFISKITRRTPTRVVIKTGVQFSLKDGNEYGAASTWNVRSIAPVTEKHRLAARRMRLGALKWDQISDTKVNRIMAILSEPEGTDSGKTN